MGAGRASRVAVAAVAGTVLLVSLLVAWAASVGPGGVLTGDGPSPGPASVTPSDRPSASASPTATPRRATPPPAPRPLPEIITQVVRALATVVGVAMLATLLGALLLLLHALWSRWELRRRPPPPPPEVEFDVVETPRRVAGAMARDADRQRLLLRAGRPRNGIVACWHRFEEQAAGTGVAREEWETPSEFTLRVLELVDADTPAVTRLAALYEEARFSDHPLDESHRTAALAALDAIHARLPAPDAEVPR